MRSLAALIVLAFATTAMALSLGYSKPQALPAVVKMYQASGLIQSGHVVRLKNATQVEKVHSAGATPRLAGVLGVSVGPNANSGQHVSVQTEGVVDSTTALAQGEVYVAGNGGNLQTVSDFNSQSGAHKRLFVVGVGTSSGDLFLTPFDTEKVITAGS